MKKSITSNNIPQKSTLNDIEREPSTYEVAEKVDTYEREDDYIPAKEKKLPLRIGHRVLRCEHFSGLLPESTGIDRETGREYIKPLRYEFVFIDAENMKDRINFTLKATDKEALNRWKQNVNQRCDGDCYREFNKNVSKDAAAPVKAFKVGAFARYLRDHDMVILYDTGSWVDKDGNYVELDTPYLHWYDPEKDNARRKWVF